MSEEDDADVVGEPPVEKRPYIQVNRRDGVESDVFLHVLDDDETTQNPKCKNIFSFGDRDDSENELQGYTFSLPSDKLCDLITINDVDVEAKAAEQKVFESFEKGDFLVDMSQVVIKESAGSGTFGCVYRAEYKERVVAVKLFKDKGLLYRLAQEIFVLAKMRHPNIVEFIGVGWKKGCEWEPALFMEYCAKGSLFQLIYSPHELKATTRAEHHHNELDMNIKKIALGVARALTFVHSLGYAHLDICSANILVNICVSFVVVICTIF